MPVPCEGRSGLMTIGLYRAWDYTIGSRDVVVAVVDNNDERHPN